MFLQSSYTLVLRIGATTSPFLKRVELNQSPSTRAATSSPAHDCDGASGTTSSNRRRFGMNFAPSGSTARVPAYHQVRHSRPTSSGQVPRVTLGSTHALRVFIEMKRNLASPDVHHILASATPAFERLATFGNSQPQLGVSHVLSSLRRQRRELLTNGRRRTWSVIPSAGARNTTGH